MQIIFQQEPYENDMALKMQLEYLILHTSQGVTLIYDSEHYLKE